MKLIMFSSAKCDDVNDKGELVGCEPKNERRRIYASLRDAVLQELEGTTKGLEYTGLYEYQVRVLSVIRVK